MHLCRQLVLVEMSAQEKCARGASCAGVAREEDSCTHSRAYLHLLPVLSAARTSPIAGSKRAMCTAGTDRGGCGEGGPHTHTQNKIGDTTHRCATCAFSPPRPSAVGAAQRPEFLRRFVSSSWLCHRTKKEEPALRRALARACAGGVVRARGSMSPRFAYFPLFFLGVFSLCAQFSSSYLGCHRRIGPAADGGVRRGGGTENTREDVRERRGG